MDSLKKHLEKIRETITEVSVGADELDGNELSVKQLKLAGQLSYLCGQHAEIKMQYLQRWLDVRAENKTEKECEAVLMGEEKGRVYDEVKYLIRGLEAMLQAIKSRLVFLTMEARHL